MKRNNPKVSIVIPAYNHQDYIGQTIDSVIAQTYRNIEVIIIDDGSSDATAETVEKKIEDIDWPIAFYSRPNLGISKTLNYGIRNATGEYIKVLASDDVLYEDAILDLLSVFKLDENFDISFGECVHGFGNKKISLNSSQNFEGQLLPNLGFYGIEDITDFFSRNCYKFLLLGSMIKNNSLERIDYFSEDVSLEDYDLYIKAINYGLKIGYVSNVVAFHRLHDGNISKDDQFMEKGISQLIRKWQVCHDHGASLVMPYLSKIAGIIPPSIINASRGRELVAWGTGSTYRRTVKNSDVNFSYAVDSDVRSQERSLLDIPVWSPEWLLRPKAKSQYVIVCSMFYEEIYSVLESYGLRREIDFF